MIGTNIAQPIGTRIPRLHRIGVVIGDPLDFSRYQGMEDDRYVLRAITDEIMYSLMSLSGQEYVDLYAADVKKALASKKDDEDAVATESKVQAPGGRQAPQTEVPEPPEDNPSEEDKTDSAPAADQ